MKRLYVWLVVSTMLMFNDQETGGGATSVSEPVALEGDVEEVVSGGEPAAQPYGFEDKLIDAINAAVGDTSIEDPGLVVTTAFCGWLRDNNVDPSAFASLQGETTSEASASVAA